MDIGSIFPIYENEEQGGLSNLSKPNTLFFSLCREAILLLSEMPYENKIVFLPSYTCSTCIDPFMQNHWTCFYYPITKNLRINTEILIQKIQELKPSILFVHPFYGIPFNDSEMIALEKIHDMGVYIICDLTQNIFYKNRDCFFDCFIGSYRKYGALPDGAFLEFGKKENYELCKKSIKCSKENSTFVDLQYEAMKLRATYFMTNKDEIKQLSRKLNKDAVDYVSKNPIALHNISNYSKKRIEKIISKQNQTIRETNYLFLLNNIKFNKFITIVNSEPENIVDLCGPLYFPIYCNDRNLVQKKLIENHIYAPILWPIKYFDALIDHNTKYIYEHILALPCAQIYSINDMQKIVNIINEIYD